MGIIPKPTSAREVAFNILYKVDKQKAYANVLLETALGKAKFAACDKALTTELIYGVLRNRGWLDGVIKPYSHRKWEKISLSVRNILRLGIYQLLKLDRVSAYAAVDETVKLARRCGESQATGFINAILRQITRKPPDDSSLPRKPLLDCLARLYSHPKWLVKRWLDRWGEEETKALCAANNRQLPLTLRVNTLRADRREVMRILADEGLEVSPDDRISEALRIENARQITSQVGYRDGFFEIEGLASMLAVDILDPQPGERILDACAGRGVKTTHIAQVMQNQGQIWALDNKPHKLKQLRLNCRRLGVDIVRPVAQDTSGPLGFGQVHFDRILLDAPCSSLGVLARYPDCRWHRQANDVSRLSKLQGNILKQVAGYLKPGGVLVYSTCSFEAEENEGVIQPFLEANREFTLDDVSPYLPDELQNHIQKDGYLRLLPHRWDGDGFFIARLLKLS